MGAATFVVDALTPLGIAGWLGYLVSVGLLQRAAARPWVIGAGAVYSGLILVGLVLSPPGVDPWLVVTNRALALAALWAVTALFLEMRTLRGLVPICAWCKKVRDDKGYWEAVEAYVSRHSRAQFTHGICPACHDAFTGSRPR